jgi:hypothetical protein
VTNETEPTGALVKHVVSNAVTSIAGANIPEPIKRNFFKAFGQLCTAAVEIPVAYMEGIAAERRAETQGRIKLIEKSANEIAEQMQFDPEYARAAVKKFGQRVVREQINLDRITQKAAESLTYTAQQQSESTEAPQAQISDDWLNVFEKEAGQKSTEEMQAMFAKVLAGEVSKPSTYSIKSVRLLGSLDQPTANMFKRFCSMCITLRIHDRIIDSRVPSLGTNAATNSLQKFGLTFDSLNLLQEYGLIIAEYNSWMDYRPSVGSPTQPVALPFEFGNEKWGLVKMDGFQGEEFKVTGIALSRSGKELMKVVPFDVEPQFATDLSAWFETRKLKMTRV